MNKTQAGSCPKCGAPIYQPFVWHGIIPPPVTYTCGCNSQVKTYPINPYFNPNDNSIRIHFETDEDENEEPKFELSFDEGKSVLLALQMTGEDAIYIKPEIKKLMNRLEKWLIQNWNKEDK